MAAAGVEVLDACSDRDHNRSVVTAVGAPGEIERALVDAAGLALERIDLRRHHGVHPRVGALDVAPVVPLGDTPREVAIETAHRVGQGISQLGIPVWWYGWMSSPPGRSLSALRRGGFEALQDNWGVERPSADLPEHCRQPHASAGVTCVGARALLLAWNVDVAGVSLEALRPIAAALRESGGGFEGLRTLALALEEQGRVQLSMNLEDVERRDVAAIFDAIEARVAAAGGRIASTEVIGMLPDALVLSVAAGRLKLSDASPERLLSRRLVRHLAHRAP